MGLWGFLSARKARAESSGKKGMAKIFWDTADFYTLQVVIDLFFWRNDTVDETLDKYVSVKGSYVENQNTVHIQSSFIARYISL